MTFVGKCEDVETELMRLIRKGRTHILQELWNYHPGIGRSSGAPFQHVLEMLNYRDILSLSQTCIILSRRANTTIEAELCTREGLHVDDYDRDVSHAKKVFTIDPVVVHEVTAWLTHWSNYVEINASTVNHLYKPWLCLGEHPM